MNGWILNTFRCEISRLSMLKTVMKLVLELSTEVCRFLLKRCLGQNNQLGSPMSDMINDVIDRKKLVTHH